MGMIDLINWVSLLGNFSHSSFIGLLGELTSPLLIFSYNGAESQPQLEQSSSDAFLSWPQETHSILSQFLKFELYSIWTLQGFVSITLLRCLNYIISLP